MVFAWLREQRRRHLREQPFPDTWLRYLEQNVPQYALLTSEEQTRLREDIQILVAEKNWEGCNGLEVTDEMRVTIAAYAALLQLNLERREYYPNVQSILIYPSSYRARDLRRNPDGSIFEGGSDRLGEAWERGPVVLSWEDAQQGGRNPRDGHNVVLHEFAHKLDMLDTSAAGVPELENQAAYDRWADVMSAEYAELVAETERGKRGLIDPYGATNAAEFFAVVTETFFEKPRQMAILHPRLYGVLRAFYRQDPAAL
jgi:Mlc titration factor MtfA (ptsG expression regulator)